MNENESLDINTNENEEEHINLEDIFGNMNAELDDDGNLILSDKIDNNSMDRDFVPENQDMVPPTPEFSDKSDANMPKENNSDFKFTNFGGQDYSKLFEIYKQLFENIASDVDTINKKIEKISTIIDSNNNEINSAIRATQIYSKLFTKLSIGINIVLFIAIIILFIIK